MAKRDTKLPDYEQLGAFYLGRDYDMERLELGEDLLLYDSADLTTHAVCVGMTGSGKTGLCVALLEEAMMDGVPAIAIDPKGDLGNLLLTFPELQPSDFEPWIDESAAAREGMTAAQYAQRTAKMWREGLAQWGQPPERIAALRDKCEMSIYTPGSRAGLGLSVLQSFAAPPASLIDDVDAMRDKVSSAASGLLALLGIDADPVQSREHILLSNLLDRAWREQRDMDLPAMIREIQDPPFQRVGVFDLETFFPAKDRTAMAMRLNNLLASPSFAGWIEGEPLNVQRLLYSDSGKPRLSIISIAHLSDAERMFFVTLLLNEVLAWVRCQSGTSSLRAILYMDEVFGYFPPTANPPSKRPMLTLLKQARAFGLGVVLATQNPVDLDYKGLANTGTWFLGRLQTERDKARVLEGLEGVATQAGSEFNKSKMDKMLAGLGKRVFLLNNVHDTGPTTFQTRWVMSYLRGPLTRNQIQKLTQTSDEEETPPAPPPPVLPADSTPATSAPPTPTVGSQAPDLPVVQRFAGCRLDPGDGHQVVYRPALVGSGSLHFVRSSCDVDAWREHMLLRPRDHDADTMDWSTAESLTRTQTAQWQIGPIETARFEDIPKQWTKSTEYTKWKRALKDYFYKEHRIVVWRCPTLKEYSAADATESEFRAQLQLESREHRDLAMQKLKKRYKSRYESLRKKRQTAQRRLQRESSQAQESTVDSAMTIGKSILGAIMGRKTYRSASSSARKARDAMEQRQDVAEARQRLEEIRLEQQELEEKFRTDADEVRAKYDPDLLELEKLEIPPRKSDIRVEDVMVLWIPWSADQDGNLIDKLA